MLLVFAFALVLCPITQAQGMGVLYIPYFLVLVYLLRVSCLTLYVVSVVTLPPIIRKPGICTTYGVCNTPDPITNNLMVCFLLCFAPV